MKLALAFAAALLQPVLALCCQCIGVSFDEQIYFADVAFVGRVLSVRDLEPRQGNTYGTADPVVYRVAVSRVFKGSLTIDTVQIRSVRTSDACGVNFNLGDTYIV